MQVSSVGRKAIEGYEGLRLTAYQDSVGVWTIGYGHTGPDVHEGLTITQEQADQLLSADLHKFEEGVSHLVRVPINQNQFDALVSFAFNLGLGSLGRSTLLKLLNSRDYKGAADQFLKWIYAGHEELPGLVIRRRAERAMFLTPVSTTQEKPIAAPQHKLAEMPVEEKPVLPVLTALLPTIVGMIPSLAKVFTDGTSVQDRNIAVAQKVGDLLVQATQAPNLQGAVESMQADPSVLEAAKKAVETEFYSLIEAGGGGITGARQYNIEVSTNAFWRMPAFWISLILMPLLYGTVYLVLTGGQDFSGELRAAIASSVVTGILGGVIGFWLGSSFTTSKSRGLGAEPVSNP